MMNQTATPFSSTKSHEDSRRKPESPLPFFVSSSCFFVDKFVFGFCKLSLTFLFALALPRLAMAQVPNYGDVSVKVEAKNVKEIGDGYGEFRATITNHSATQSHKVTVQIPFYGYGSSVEISQVSRTVELAPQSTASLPLFSPSSSSNYGYSVILIDGVKQNPDAQIDTGSIGTTSDSGKASALLSQQVFKSGFLSATNIEQGWKGSSGESLVSTQSFDIPVSEWSQNWMSYARFGGVMLQADELNAAPETVRLALLRYVERGGTLIVAGNWQPPAQWQAWRGGIKDEEVKDDESNPTALPAPSATPAPPASQTQPHKPQADLLNYHVGFGLVIITGSTNPNDVAVNQWKRIRLELSNHSLADEEFDSLAEVNQAFKIIEQFGVPIRGLFLLMLVFVLVIGPVNLIWLAKKKRKIWMLWTVPAISLLTCLMVAGFSLFGEGWNSTAKTEALTILDETNHRATTIGWTGFYSPITPSEGLRFGFDTELAPQLPRYWDYRSRMPERTIDWTNDQHLDAGWVAARIPAFFKLRKNEARRERLNIRQSGEEASLVNGLGAEITQVWWADAAGKIHSAQNIAPGSQAKLQPTELKASATTSRLREIYSGDWLKEFQSLTNKPQEALMPNCYLAVLNGSPFVEEGLSGVKNRAARNLVYGISDQYRAR
ncbi:MAG: hypothetical protein ACKVZH_16520 [Blastocatellia bacterium]